MGLVRTHYNPYRTKIKKAAEGMVVSSENAINENPNVEEEEKSKKQQRLEKKLAKLEGKISHSKIVHIGDINAYNQFRND